MYDWDSKEEEYFFWYLQELDEAGYIERFKYQPKPFSLSDKVTFTWNKQLKTKKKVMVKSLIQGHKYQADFLIIWKRKAAGIFFRESIEKDILSYPFSLDLLLDNVYRSIVDVKGTFNQNDAWRRFSIERKWVWQRYHINVEKIIPEKLFKETFTPQRYLTTDKSNKPRKIAWKVHTLAEYVSSL